MRTFLPTLAATSLLFASLLPATAEDAAPAIPDPKVGTRLKFQAYDGNPKKPETMTFQVNTLDIRQPSEFVKIGDTISNTPYKLTKLAFKEIKNPSSGDTEDVSELTVVNTKTKEEFILVLDKTTRVR